MTGLWPQVRLFGLLALLVPLFVGLQYLVQESVPQIEVRFIPPDAQNAAQQPAERVVERVVYVPVEKTEAAPLRDPAAGSSLSAARNSEPVKASGMDSTVAAVAAAPPAPPAPLQAGAEEPAGEQVADAAANGPESGEEPAVHMGVVAVVTPVAPPPARVVPAQPRYVPPAVVAAAPVVEEEEPEAAAEETVAEEPVEPEPVVAEAEPQEPIEQIAEIKVLETMVDGSQTTRVVSYKVPVHRPAPSQQAQPEPAAEPEAVAEEPEAAAPEPVAEESEAAEPEAADETAAPEDEAVAPEDEAGVAESAGPDETPVGVAEAEPIADAEPIEEVEVSGEAELAGAPDEGAGDEMMIEGPADAKIEEDEPIAVEVVEIERPNPSEPTVSTVSVTTVMIDPDQ